MNSAFDTLQLWARKACHSAGLAVRKEPAREPAALPRESVAYRLRAWPTLPPSQCNARVWRLMSTMSVRPVDRGWMLEQSRLAPEELDALIDTLRRDRVVEVIELPASPLRDPQPRSAPALQRATART
ncbi:hypothetical protein [Ramlibacter rhizophilus]|uniref:Uncharacterized protein n=1 Tax=Ramlibacter rhizophilus TaxID=1781167 RepID=A0A4Z0BRH8_9BURK|nr:hypothetical protein [Ramlibacter rhizophilus]TFZ01352.1 hypothetical protein EZ242_08195 [Ramlibacter rhizophilus]